MRYEHRICAYYFLLNRIKLCLLNAAYIQYLQLNFLFQSKLIIAHELTDLRDEAKHAMIAYISKLIQTTKNNYFYVHFVSRFEFFIDLIAHQFRRREVIREPSCNTSRIDTHIYYLPIMLVFYEFKISKSRCECNIVCQLHY